MPIPRFDPRVGFILFFFAENNWAKAVNIFRKILTVTKN